MTNQIKKKLKEAKDNFKQNPREVYFKFFSLVEQARNARVVADAVWRCHMQLIYHTGEIKNVTNYSRVALENFAVSELWKLYDKKNSVFHIWDVAGYLNNPILSKWLDINFKKIQSDVDLISEWRHDAIGHRGEAGYYTPNLRQPKFSTARVSEQKLRDFLVDFLCQIDRELWGTDIEDIKQGMRASKNSFKQQVEKEMKETFKSYDDSK